MKSYEQIRQDLQEVMSTRSDIAVDENGGLFDLNDDAVVEKLNQFVSSIGIREYIIPENAVSILRRKLGLFGISFGDVNMVEDSGEIEIPLVQYGGKFGKDLDTPYDEFINEDETGRSINFVYERTSAGSFAVLARIV